jgi:hypothetical protein
LAHCLRVANQTRLAHDPGRNRQQAVLPDLLARVRLPVLLDHLRSDAGRLTHRVADVLKIGNHELELLIDKNASGVAVVEPYVALRSPGAPSNFKWLWWVVAAVVIFYLFARH